MNAYPFSVFKRADRSCYSLAFKDSNGKYLRPVSSGKKTEAEAIQVGFQWLRDGIPQKNTVVKVSDLTLKEMVRKLKDGNEAETLLAELSRQGFVKSYVRNDTPEAVDFVSFLTDFWDWDNSGLKARRYLFAPMEYGGRIAVVKITVKEYENSDLENKLYSIEAVGVDLRA